MDSLNVSIVQQSLTKNDTIFGLLVINDFT